ncbi:Rap GTPase activating proteins domain-containing protein [Rozella allomycis CSF55]|uniref:Rap GTPase activating proteins domain-containing protein n=1 Tax=Rozella allomycis (strain CSF55) TaxID=988480 RepID=A0A075AYT1_ROZAC|nr:Rap GTPase activating proteins domain-containing protein [Rozella allomycis CSF55]|eukprot:EPZ35432.1 Rap GTPase activating proteins domain-containing protein [Rozella allomycis CSF55]
MHAAHHLHSFPNPIPEILGSNWVDDPVAACKHFCVNDSLIMSVVYKEDSILIVTRNNFGKFTWSVTPLQSDCSYKTAELQPFDIKCNKMEEINYGFKRNKVEPPTVPEKKVNVGRVFLSQFGFLDADVFRKGSFSIFSDNQNLLRDIKALDKKPCRELVKVALIYVAKDQEYESSILANQNPSISYRKFVSSLGWTVKVFSVITKVDLESHLGYMGGLDRNLTTGKYSIYYCDSFCEIMFHDVTLIPSDHNDPKNIKKKRHIGNDHIHIVWNENNKPYKPNTISGDFGNVVIVINPLKSGLFAIDVYRDQKVTFSFRFIRYLSLAHSNPMSLYQIVHWLP